MLIDKNTAIWFKRKRYGWGWTPATWQGWTVTAVYIILILILGLRVDKDTEFVEVILFFIVPTIVLSFLMIGVAYKKGEKPCWQWGKDINDSR